MSMAGHIPAWWLHDTWVSRALVPVAWLFRIGVLARRVLYRHGLRSSHRPGIPVIVIGNIFVGGTGKTPLVVHTVALLRALGRQPAVLSRGHRSRAGRGPRRVQSSDTPEQVGDEPLLIHRLTDGPVYVGSDRRASAGQAEADGADVLICDDGLQHYALARDLEIVVLDSERGLGNERMIPAGPLREPVQRLAEVDAVIANGFEFPGADLHFELVPGRPEPVGTLAPGEDPSLPQADPPDPAGEAVHAVTGIGHPERFFEALEALGYTLIRHAWPDHHGFSPEDLAFPDARAIIMTGKDAVKCSRFREIQRAWWLPVRVAFPEGGSEAYRRLFHSRLHSFQGGVRRP